jgi:hypothetical protein
MAIAQVAKYGLAYEKCREFAVDLAHNPEWERSLRKLFARQPCNLFLCCLTERWNSGAMWALYAKKHTGIVFGLNCRALPDRARALTRVAYSEIRPQTPMVKVNPDILAQAVETKSPDWAYQGEWRAASGTAETENLSQHTVAEVIVGYQASAKLIKSVKAFKNLSPSTKIYHAYPHPQRHEMARQEI